METSTRDAMLLVVAAAGSLLVGLAIYGLATRSSGSAEPAERPTPPEPASTDTSAETSSAPDAGGRDADRARPPPAPPSRPPVHDDPGEGPNRFAAQVACKRAVFDAMESAADARFPSLYAPEAVTCSGRLCTLDAHVETGGSRRDFHCEVESTGSSWKIREVEFR